MNCLKTNPIGIDAEIQGIQSRIYKKLKGWDLEGFGRAEIDEEEPIVFYRKNDYKKVLYHNPRFSGKFFFVDSETTSLKDQMLTTKIDLYFLLNLKKIKPTVEHRADEEARMDILNILRSDEITIVKGIEALSDFKTTLEDLQPYHFLKFSFDVEYQSINKC